MFERYTRSEHYKYDSKGGNMKIRSRRGMSILILGYLLVLLCGGLAHAQTERWVYQDTEDGQANSIVYGSDNNTYIVGYIAPAGSDSSDFYVLGLDTMGALTWSYNYNGSADNNDEAGSVAYGDDGYIYAAGYSIESGTDRDFIVISLTSSGTEFGVYTYDGLASLDDEANSIVYGDDGYIYAAGYSVESGTDKDFTVLSVNSDGTERWIFTYDGTASGNDIANSVIFGADGNIYVAGYSTESGTNKDIIIISIDSATGDSNWVYTYDGGSSRNDEAHAIIYGEDGNLYVAGYSRNVGTYKQFTVLSVDTSGNERWVYKTVIPDTRHEEAYSILYGSDNNIYAAGYVWILWNYNDFAVVRLDTTGVEKWIYTYNGAASRDDEVYSLVCGENDNLYAAGYSKGVGVNGKSLKVVSIDTSGTETWTYFYDVEAGSDDVAHSIIYGSDGNLYIAGYSDDEAYTVISLDPTLRPEMWTYPNFIMVMIDSGETTDRELKIANLAAEGCIPLDWSITERPPVDWLDEDPTSGSLSSGDTVVIAITFDATELPPDAYYDTLEIISNDPTNATKDIPVKLTVRDVGIEEYTDTQLEDRCELLSSFFNKTISLQFTMPSDTPCEILLYNVLGVRVYETGLSSTPSWLYLDDKYISELSQGVYFLSVSRSEKVYPVMKLIKY